MRYVLCDIASMPIIFDRCAGRDWRSEETPLARLGKGLSSAFPFLLVVDGSVLLLLAVNRASRRPYPQGESVGRTEERTKQPPDLAR